MCAHQLPYILKALCFFLHVLTILARNSPSHYNLPQSIAISCGSPGDFTAPDGRAWLGDSGLKSSSSLQVYGKSLNSRTIHKLASLDSVTYKTARISRHEFSYVLPVKAGQKFIRLHFYQDSYKGFKRSKPLFTVKAGPYTLLANFSTSLESDAMGAKKIIKEYCINIEDGDQPLIVTFFPTQKTRKGDDFYAFINGIEVVPMPTGLYFTPEGELGPRVVGQKYRFYIDNNTALEMVQRLNVGGTSISPAEDFSMFRRWDEDTSYLSETGVFPVVTIENRGSPTHIAPTKVYQTARSIHGDTTLSANNLAWKIPAELGFRYLIRFHLSEFQPRVAENGHHEFSIFINNQIAEDDSDVNRRIGAPEVAAYRDYIVMMEGDKMDGWRNITIVFKPKSGSREKLFHGSLNGLEIFKLSNPDNNLAGMGRISELQSSTSTLAKKKVIPVYNSNLIATVLTVILSLLNIAVYYLKIASESNSRKTKLFSKEHMCRVFSIDEIRSSTNNFDPQCHIGSGGYGRVYKGSIDGGTTAVAIKRLKPESRQGENEFWTEIKMLSKIRHEHLVSLIGYCNDGHERLLVYQYMARGTLSDHLYKENIHGKPHLPLSWELRLKVSIGAARGLYYLHSRRRVIHRDVKSSNILLDENWVAKISDFGLSKMGPANDSFSHISTNVKGTFGYLDPEYFLTRKLTRKSDVYAFGVVLFEVLSGRPAIDIRLEEEQHSLAGWARYCIREGKVEPLVDHDLIGQISPACLKVFVGIAGRCVHTQPQGRPAMADVVMGLELALALQQNSDPMEQVEGAENAVRILSDHSDGVISMDDTSMTPPKGESDRMVIDVASSSIRRNRSNGQRSAKAKANNNSSSNSNSSSRWWWNPFGFLPRSSSKLKASPLSTQVVTHQFFVQEIQKATNNFDRSFIIGFRGSDNVYRGYINDGQKAVAIRWSKIVESRCCVEHDLQLKKGVQKKSSKGQEHVAFMIGYCEAESDLYLVYDYMENGTLHDCLHEPNKDPLPWKLRLQICIGTARGLGCIHSIVKQTMLHRDFKSTNIWLDENWIPSVSEWGLYRKKDSNQAPAVARGNWGHLDSDFIRGDELTEKSYVYSFGLVLFEVLFAGKQSDRWLDEDQVSLAQWIKLCMRSNVLGSIDTFLVGRMAADSLKTFIETAESCLLDHGVDRPSITDIVIRLEDALKQQEAAESDRGAQLLRR